MIKRTIEISGANTRLTLKHGQLNVWRDEERIGKAPVEDIGVLIVDTPTASYTHGTLTALAKAGGVAVLCGNDHHPVSMVLPVQANSLQSLRTAQQARAAKPLCKQLWRQLIQAKLRAQAQTCPNPDIARRLREYAKRVRSGDPDNLEAQGARAYWGIWLPGQTFRRRREGDPPNNLLNYGYMALRAAVARAICGAGLHPSLGLNHSNRFNAFCLADDLTEPFRAIVDWRVRDLFLNEGMDEINKESKRTLLGLLTHTCRLDENTGPLLVMLERMAASLVRCYAGESRNLNIPIPIFDKDCGNGDYGI